MAVGYNPSIVSDGLVGYLDAANQRSYSGSGTFWFDLSGTGNTAYLINGPSFSGAGGSCAISCDGTNDYIEIIDNSNLDFGSNNFTVEYWFKKLALTNGFDNFWGVNKWNTGGTPGTNEWTLNIGEYSSIECVHFLIESGNTIYTTGIHTLPNPTSQFHQVVGIRNGSKLELYLDGTQLYSNTPAGMAISTSVNNVSSLNLRVANTAPTNLYTNSSSSVIRVYRKALTPQEILQNFNATRFRYGI